MKCCFYTNLASLNQELSAISCISIHPSIHPSMHPCPMYFLRYFLYIVGGGLPSPSGPRDSGSLRWLEMSRPRTWRSTRSTGHWENPMSFDIFSWGNQEIPWENLRKKTLFPFVDFGQFAKIGVLLDNFWATPSLVKEFVSLGSGLLRGMVTHVGSSFVIDDLWQWFTRIG